MAVLDSAHLASLSKSYLEENIASRLTNTAIAFLALQTVAVVLFYLSRYTTKTLDAWDCWVFMPVGFIFSTGVCVLGLCNK